MSEEAKMVAKALETAKRVVRENLRESDAFDEPQANDMVALCTKAIGEWVREHVPNSL